VPVNDYFSGKVRVVVIVGNVVVIGRRTAVVDVLTGSAMTLASVVGAPVEGSSTG
jgi:hypothetical protein